MAGLRHIESRKRRKRARDATDEEKERNYEGEADGAQGYTWRGVRKSGNCTTRCKGGACAYRILKSNVHNDVIMLSKTHKMQRMTKQAANEFKYLRLL
jgi:hypothetical protein